MRASLRLMGSAWERRRARRHRRSGNRARDARAWIEAVAHYRAYLALRPDDAAIWIQLGHMESEAGNWPAADRAYRTAWRLTPRDADLLLCWGHSRALAGDLPAARVLYRRSHAADPANAAAQCLNDLPGGTLEEGGHRFAGRIDAVVGIHVSGTAVLGIAAEPSVEFRQGETVVGIAALTDPDEHGRCAFTATLDVRASGRIDVYRRPDGMGFANSPFEVRIARADEQTEPRAWSVRAEIIRPARIARGVELALLATTSCTGALPPHLEAMVATLRDQGIAVVVIATTDRPLDIPSSLLALVDGLIVRASGGGAWGGWAHLLRLFPGCYGACKLYLLTDDVVVSNASPALTAAFSRMRESAADLVALTASNDHGWHPERFCLVLGPRLLRWERLQQVFERLPRDLPEMDDQTFEPRLAREIEAAGFTIEILFPSRQPVNPLEHDWPALAAVGMPFASARTASRSLRRSERRLLTAHDFDADLIEAVRRPIAAIPPMIGDDRLLARPLPVPKGELEPLNVALVGAWHAATKDGQAIRAIATALRGLGHSLNVLAVGGDDAATIAPAVDMLDFRSPADRSLVVRSDEDGTLRIALLLGDDATSTERWRIGRAAGDLDPALLEETPAASAALGGWLSTRLTPAAAIPVHERRDPPPWTPLDITLQEGITPAQASGCELLTCVLAADGSCLGSAGEKGQVEGGEQLIAFMPGGSILAPMFANIIANHAARHPGVDFFYADDVACWTANPIDQLRLKPAFDWLLLAAQDYVGAPVIVRTAALQALGGLNPARGTAALADLLFRASAAGLAIGHLPEVLLAHPARRVRARAADYHAMLRAQPSLSGYEIGDGAVPNSFSLGRRFLPDEAPMVSLVIPTCQSAMPSGRLYLERLLDGIERTEWPHSRLEVIVGDDRPDASAWMETSRPFALRRLVTPRPDYVAFNYAAKMNRLWREAAGEQIVFLNDDVCPLAPDWLAALQTFTADPRIGGVGAQLLFEDSAIQHAGLAPHGNSAAHAWVYRPTIDGTYQQWAQVHRQWSMVTGAVFATRRTLLKTIGGFDERLSLEFNDTDLCLRLRALGYAIAYAPRARLVHTEKASRGTDAPPGDERALFMSRWSGWLDRDPAWHPFLRRDMSEMMPDRPPPVTWYL